MFDFIKMMLLGLITIMFVYIYDVGISYMWLSLLIFPFAQIPYTYFWSFIFQTEDAGEKFMMIHSFLLGGLVPIAMLVL